METSVAIFQNAIHFGGRLRVLISFTEVLNDMGIRPDWVAFKIDLNRDGIKRKYRKDIIFSRFEIPFVKLPYELEILALNHFMVTMKDKYDLVISSNNSLALLETLDKNSIFYMHFPRKARLESELASIHFPEGPPSNPMTIDGLFRLVTKPFYKISKPPRSTTILANSEYTKECTLKSYPTLRRDQVEVIYPPVSLLDFAPSDRKGDLVATLGRFEETKRQLEQLQIARMTPELEFRIGGFVFSSKYYEKCKSFMKKEGIDNAKLLPNLSFDEAMKILVDSKFFLHNVRNEPFGISSVEAIMSGCIPVVHDSGGQREIVNFDSLRFESAHQASRILKELADEPQKSLGTMREKLQSHAEAFSETSFKKAVRRKIEGLLSRSS